MGVPLRALASYLRGLGIERIDFEPRRGDVSFNVFGLARERKVPPERLAEDLASSIDHPLVDRAEAIGGFVNIYLDREEFVKQLWREALSPDYGRQNQGRTIVIDFSSPNVAKPMHVGHLRSTIIGNALRRILKFAGNNVIGINYLGDVGTQFGALIAAYKRWVDREKLQEDPIKELLRIYVKFHEEAERDPSLEEEARREFERLEKGDEENRRLWREFVDLSLKGFEKIYSRLGVEFDIVTGESAFVEGARKIAEELLEKGIAVIGKEGQKKGAIVADLEDEGLNHPVLLKSDGTTIYLSRDLASLLWRVKEFDPDALIYVVAIEQSLHFKQLFSIARKLGIDKELVHLAFGMVHVEGMRLSTRRGQVLFLEDVLNRAVERAAEEMKERGTYTPSDAERIGVSAVIFWMLKYEPNKDITFRWRDVVSFTGETGPYVQYAYVRAKHILEKGEKEMEPAVPDDREWELVKAVARFPLVIEAVSKRYQPHVLARHLLSLASTFHNFYERERVVGHPREPFRLWLTAAVKNVLERGQHLLGMKPPERM